MTPLTITVPGELRGKGRPRFGRGRTFTDARTVNAEAWVRACAVEQAGQPVLEGALALEVTIACQVPASWPAKRRQAALEGAVRPTGRPDLDNMLKTATDALNGVLWRDDAQLVEVTVRKRYGAVPETVLIVSQA